MRRDSSDVVLDAEAGREARRDTAWTGRVPYVHRYIPYPLPYRPRHYAFYTIRSTLELQHRADIKFQRHDTASSIYHDTISRRGVAIASSVLTGMLGPPARSSRWVIASHDTGNTRATTYTLLFYASTATNVNASRHPRHCVLPNSAPHL